MTTKRRVLDVGNCSPDHHAIRQMLLSTVPEVEVLQSHGPDDTLHMLRESSFDLVLINRKLDQDYSDGTEILKRIKAEPQLVDIPVMLVTNYEEHQADAIALGAIRGFGKLELNAKETHQRVAEALKC